MKKILATKTVPQFFKPFSLEEKKPPVFPEPGAPRNSVSSGLVDWFVRRELKEGWKKKPAISLASIIPTLHGRQYYPLSYRERSATHWETWIGLHKMLSWIESGGDEFSVNAEVQHLFELLSEAISRLNRIALTHPELLRPFAEHAHAWPILYSDHKTFRKNNAKLIKAIRLSNLHHFNLEQSARTDLDDELTKASSDLVYYLNEARRNLALQRDYSNRKPGGEQAYRFDPSTLPRWYLASAKLEKFSKDTWGKWWELGRAAFLESYPRPENETRFSHVKDTTPGRRRAKILWLMKDRMEKLAAKASY